MRIYGFEKLKVWQESRQLVVIVYEHTRQFPSDEKFGLTAQIRRSAISVASNIAEGSGRSSIKDRQKFYRIAYGSLMELLNQLIIAVDLGMISEDLLNVEFRPLIEKISLSLYTLKGRK